jgi:hypothetical protein
MLKRAIASMWYECKEGEGGTGEKVKRQTRTKVVAGQLEQTQYFL